MNSGKALIVLNGTPPSRKVLRNLVRGADIVVAADGGSEALIAASLPFQVVVGDLDSLPNELSEKYPDVQVVHDECQDTTDAEKALEWVLRNTNAREIVLTGVHSEELDHVLGTLSVCAKYAERARLYVVEDTCLVYFVTDILDLNREPGEKVTLIGLPIAEGIRTQGLRWALSSETLRFGGRDGVHNEIVETPARISIREGCLGVLLCRHRSDPVEWPHS